MNEFKSNPSTCKILIWITTIISLWIHYSNCLRRNHLWDRMVISNNNIHSKRFCMFDHIDVLGSTINRYYQSCSNFFYLIYKVFFKSISIMNSMRKSIAYLYPNFFEKMHQNRSRGCSIYIIVSIDHDFFTLIDGQKNPIYCGSHA